MSSNHEPCVFLDWDTTFFGCRIARVKAQRLDAESLAQIEAWCATNRIDGLYFLAEPDDPLTVSLAEQHGFGLQDVRITYRVERTAWREALPVLDASVTLRRGHCDDVERLRQTARHAYVHSRFYNDQRFSRAKCAELYDVWLTRSTCEDGFADVVMIAEWDHQPAAYITCHLRHETQMGEIGLVGVAEEARGQHLGQALLQHSLRWFWEQGMERVQVGTQARNLAAQRLYQRCGFLTYAVHLWYHKWFSDCVVS